MSVLWIAAEWPAPANIVAGTTLRAGGVSEDEFASLNLADHVGDKTAAVAENRRRLRSDLALPAEPSWLRQVHGISVATDDSPPSAPEADGMVAMASGVVCAVLTADCLPVLLTTSSGTAVAAAHAGWRGLSAGIVEATLASLESPAEQTMAWLGPAISQSAFEVGDEVREQFMDRSRAAEACFSANSRGRWQADLYGLATLRLQECGVTQVFGGGYCTHAERERFFSFRRDGRCGRMATFIYRRE